MSRGSSQYNPMNIGTRSTSLMSDDLKPRPSIYQEPSDRAQGDRNYFGVKNIFDVTSTEGNFLLDGKSEIKNISKCF